MKDQTIITCPKCGHEQQEPSLVVSCYCKGCGTHLDMARDGIQRRKAQTSRVAIGDLGKSVQSMVGKWKEKLASAAAKATTKSSAQPVVQATPVPAQPVIAQTPAPTDRDDSSSATDLPKPPVASSSTAMPSKRPDDAPTPSAYQPKSRTKPRATAQAADSSPSPARSTLRNDRTVQCFACGEDFSAPRIGPAPACPECGHQALSCDLVIETAKEGDHLTYGNIRILKRGSIAGGRIACHHFAAYGRFSGTIECAGRVEINVSGKMDAAITCRELVIPRRTDVKFTGPVIADRIEVEGKIDAHALINTELSIPSGGEFQGDVITRTLNVDDNALLAADLQIHPSPNELRDEFIRSFASPSI